MNRKARWLVVVCFGSWTLTGCGTAEDGARGMDGSDGTDVVAGAGDTDGGAGIGDAGDTGGGAGIGDIGDTGGAGDADPDLCGNQQLDPPEACDGDLLAGASCLSQGFQGGTLACTPACELDTSACSETSVCGDGQLAGGELCDGAIVPASCADFRFEAGELRCTDQCTYDTSSCAAPRLRIAFDYRLDSTGFFADPTRRELLEWAALTWADHLAEHFEPIELPATLPIRNPSDRSEDVDVTIEEGGWDLLIFVGAADIDGQLGRGTSLMRVDPAWSNDYQWELHDRYTGDDFEPWVGSLSFDAFDIGRYHFDPTPETADDIPSDRYDFLSTAIHEIGHVLGISLSCEAFQDNVDNGTYVGGAAYDFYGGPVPMANADHFQQDLVVDGAAVCLDPGDSTGERQLPSPFEIGVMEDIGYGR